MPSTPWYYSTGDDHQDGPVAASVLERLARSGDLRPDDLVWRDGMGEWVPATKVRGLTFSGGPRKPSGTTRVACEHCRQSYRVDSSKLGTTTTCKKCGKVFTLTAESAETAPNPAESGDQTIVARDTLLERLRADPRRTGQRLGLAGAIALVISLPLQWTVAYSSGLGHGGTMSTHGWWVAIPVLGVLGLVLAQRQQPEQADRHAKIAGGLCFAVMLFAIYTLLGVMTVGDSVSGPIRAGVRTGPGLWFAILGAIVCGVGQFFVTQADLLTPTDADGNPRTVSESLQAVTARAQRIAERARNEQLSSTTKPEPSREEPPTEPSETT